MHRCSIPLAIIALCVLVGASVAGAQEEPEPENPVKGDGPGLEVAERTYLYDQSVQIQMVDYELGDFDIVGTAKLIGLGEKPDPPCGSDLVIELDEKATMEIAEAGKTNVVVPVLCTGFALVFTERAKVHRTDDSGREDGTLIDGEVESTYYVLLNKDLHANEKGDNTYYSESLKKFPLLLEEEAVVTPEGGASAATYLIPAAALGVMGLGALAFMRRRHRA